MMGIARNKRGDRAGHGVRLCFLTFFQCAGIPDRRHCPALLRAPELPSFARNWTGPKDCLANPVPPAQPASQATAHDMIDRPIKLHPHLPRHPPRILRCGEMSRSRSQHPARHLHAAQNGLKPVLRDQSVCGAPMDPLNPQRTDPNTPQGISTPLKTG